VPLNRLPARAQVNQRARGWARLQVIDNDRIIFVARRNARKTLLDDLLPPRNLLGAKIVFGNYSRPVLAVLQ
jgi:hypothetical protein